jgi:chromosomal replication initiator protein
MQNPQKIWQAALGELELQMTRATYNTWIRPVSAVSYDQDTFVLGTPNGYIKDWLENRLHAPIQRTLSGILGQETTVQIIVWVDEQEVGESANLPLLHATQEFHSSARTTGRQLSGNGHRGGNGNGSANGFRSTAGNGQQILNPRYTFDSFVVGPSNRLAHAAAQAVADAPARAYNPLFLYGGVGLGKTHLLHAIGHACRTRGMEVLCVSSEEFTNDLINAIRNKETIEFRGKYRTLDVLLIDDIQFIAGKESTQEEFFHTFNTLHAGNSQIVLTCDRAPKAIPTLEERLRSRFEWGLLADIQPPDLETRIAILREKAEKLPIAISEELLTMIGQRVVSNIRELEGALNKVVARARLSNTPPTAETLEASLQDLIAAPKTLTVSQVIAGVTRYYRVSDQEIKGRRRTREIVRPRQVAMYLARTETQASLPEIGGALGGRDHTTVLYGVQKIEGLLEQDNTLRRDVATIQEQLYQ